MNNRKRKLLTKIRTQAHLEYDALKKYVPKNRFKNIDDREVDIIIYHLKRLSTCIINYIHIKIYKGSIKNASTEDLRDIYFEEFLIDFHTWFFMKMIQNPSYKTTKKEKLLHKLLYFATVDITLTYLRECREYNYYVFCGRLTFWLWAKKSKELFLQRKIASTAIKHGFSYGGQEKFYEKVEKELNLFDNNENNILQNDDSQNN